MDLKGTVALVTGGNGGLGQRICHALAQEGAHVAIMYARSRDQAESVASELASRYHIKAQAFACDITDGAAVDRLVGEVTQAFGRLDVLVNDAAYNLAIPFANLDDLTLEVWERIMATNLTGPMLLTKAVAPVMKAQGRGRIVNIASIAGLSPTGSSIAYAVSKAGLIHLTRCMAVALAPETLVNCVAPGLLEGTRATANLRPEFIANSAATSLLKKPADKDDCADMVVTMCRTETMTGQTMVIDSGRYFIDAAAGKRGFQCLLRPRRSRARPRSPKSEWPRTAGTAVIRIESRSPIPRTAGGATGRNSSMGALRSSPF